MTGGVQRQLQLQNKNGIWHDKRRARHSQSTWATLCELLRACAVYTDCIGLSLSEEQWLPILEVMSLYRRRVLTCFWDVWGLAKVQMSTSDSTVGKCAGHVQLLGRFSVLKIYHWINLTSDNTTTTNAVKNNITNEICTSRKPRASRGKFQISKSWKKESQNLSRISANYCFRPVFRLFFCSLSKSQASQIFRMWSHDLRSELSLAKIFLGRDEI